MAPNQPRKENPARAVRVSDSLWTAAKKKAAERGETVSDIIRKALERYVKK
jgi:predicted DNA binding CopG/RHH family protein